MEVLRELLRLINGSVQYLPSEIRYHLSDLPCVRRKVAIDVVVEIEELWDLCVISPKRKRCRSLA